jgi:hypothetical protein
MRPYDRDYFMSSFSVLMHQRRHILMTLDDMAMRIEEMEMQFALMCDQQESDKVDTLVEDAWMSGRNFAEAEWENDEILYDSARKPKLCTCDECWGVDNKPDESKQKYSTNWVDDALNKMRRVPQDYKMD